ncbi:MAG: DUF2851 family protein [Flavobacteriales bacterium]|nr:DUF2851 family protein [Flavobacteriales bacterium]
MLDMHGLITSQEEKVEIVSPGERNVDAGPDFFNAKIRIGDTLWAGNVEIHVKASDWKLHKHHLDKAYDNIILHVVYESSKPVLRKNGNEIPELIIKEKFNNQLLQTYIGLVENKDTLPCKEALSSVDPFIVSSWMERVLVERLEEKSALIVQSLDISKNNWEEVFLLQLAKNFGFNVNGLPFELMIKSIPFKCIMSCRVNLLTLEACLFGQAGFLDSDIAEDYTTKLSTEYSHLKNKFNLVPLQKHLWKFSRMRPNNFPTVRISQFANLLYLGEDLFSKLMQLNKVDKIRKHLECSASEFWNTHYTFNNKQDIQKIKQLGKNSIDNLIINTIVPFMFVYGVKSGKEELKNRALDLLRDMKIERNKTVSLMLENGFLGKSSFESQAMLQLYKHYCTAKKCLACNVGTQIIRRSIDD